MIDIKELRRLAQAATLGPDGVSLSWITLLQDFQQGANPTAINELLDRLEVAEKDIALKDKIIDVLGSKLNAVSNERDALNAKIAQLHKEADKFGDGIDWIQRALQAEAKVEAMERQEPVAEWLPLDSGEDTRRD